MAKRDKRELPEPFAGALRLYEAAKARPGATAHEVAQAALIDRMAEALAFARSVIQSGERWTDTCERVINGALRRVAQEREGRDGR